MRLLISLYTKDLSIKSHGGLTLIGSRIIKKNKMLCDRIVQNSGKPYYDKAGFAVIPIVKKIAFYKPSFMVCKVTTYYQNFEEIMDMLAA